MVFEKELNIFSIFSYFFFFLLGPPAGQTLVGVNQELQCSGEINASNVKGLTEVGVGL